MSDEWKETTPAPTAAANADATWDEATSGHAVVGSTGKALTDLPADTTDDVWDEATSGHTTPGTTGQAIIDTLEEATEVAKHVHSYHRLCGAAAEPDGEVHVADSIEGPGTTAVTYFVPDAGNDSWGGWVQVLGTNDTPVQDGMTKFDFSEIFVANVERKNAVYYIQMAFGTSGDAAVTAGEYSMGVFQVATGALQSTSIPIASTRQDAGTKVWVRVFVNGQDTGWASILIDLHEYLV